MDSAYHIQKALDYIEANLKNKLYLEELADKANFSAWHFHRVFNALTGVTVGECQKHHGNLFMAEKALN